MKRSGQLRRTGGLRRRGFLARGGTLRRSAWRRTQGAMEQLASGRWRVLPTERCTVCGKAGTRDNPLQAHHTVSRERLVSWCETQAHQLGLGAMELDELRARVVWDTRNRMVLHAVRHTGHTDRSAPLPLHLVPAATHEFAAELGLVPWLLRFYPTDAGLRRCYG